eukprot:1932899-Prorocentrum_lima.AAC.1
MRASSEAEGSNFDAQQLLTEAFSAKNCLTTAVQYTPYQPALLLGAERGEAHCDDSLDDGVSRF